MDNLENEEKILSDEQEEQEQSIEQTEQETEKLVLELENTKKLLLEKEEALKEAQDKVLYIRADFENTKKRLEKDFENRQAYLAENLISDFLPILDSFDRALENKEIDENDNVYKGLKLIQKQVEDVFAKLGVKKLECLDQTFDPNLHSALMHQDVADKDENKIIAVCNHGYTYKGKVLRHASVVVSKKELKEN